MLRPIKEKSIIAHDRKKDSGVMVVVRDNGSYTLGFSTRKRMTPALLRKIRSKMPSARRKNMRELRSGPPVKHFVRNGHELTYLNISKGCAIALYALLGRALREKV